MTKLSLLLAVALFSCAPPRSAGRVATGTVREIPFELRHGKVAVPVRVDSSRVRWLLLDTGMGFDGVLLYEAIPDSGFLARAISVRIPGAGTGEPARGLMAESASFRVGPVAFAGQRLVCLTDSLMSGFPSDGVLGYTLFGHWVVELDYDRMTITLHEPGGFKPDSTWTRLPLTLHKNSMPWVKLRASIGGEEAVELDCYLDLPEFETIVFLVRDNAKFKLPDGLAPSYLGRGLSGDISGWKGRVAEIALDTFRFENVAASFAPDEARSKQEGADAVIGGGLLNRFNTVYDYANGRLYIRPNKRK